MAAATGDENPAPGENHLAGPNFFLHIRRGWHTVCCQLYDTEYLNPQTNMKLSKTLLCGLVAVGSTLLTYGEDVTGTVAVGYNSIYEFRGVDLGSNMVEASASIATTYNGFGFSATAWYATVNDNANNPTPNELDLTLGITKSLGPVNLSGGYIYYNFFGANSANTQELYLGASMEIIAGISASATAYRDVDLFDGTYVDFNLSKTFKPCSAVDIVTVVGMGLADDSGWQLKANGRTLDGYQQFYAMVTVPWTIRKGVTLAPYLRYVNADGALMSEVPGAATGGDHIIGGIKLTCTF